MAISLDLPWGSSQTKNQIHYFQRVFPVGTQQQNSYNSQGWKNRARPVVGSRPLYGDWRDPSPYRMYAVRCEGEAYDFQYLGTGGTWRRWGSDSPRSASLGPGANFFWHGSSGTGRFPRVSSNLYNRAVTEALQKAARGKMQLALAVAEARKSFNTVVNRFIRLVNALWYWRRGNFRDAAYALGVSNSRQLAQTYLEYQYGWRPLMSDVYDGIDITVNGLKGPAPFYVTRTVSEDLPPYAKPSAMKVWRYKGKTKSGVMVRLDYQVTSQWLQQFNQLGLINPLTLAWELVPWSFVLDWLIPIGNWLEALTATVGLQFRGGSVSRKSWSDVEVEYCTEEPISGSLPKLRLRSVYLERTVLGSSPLPLPYVRSPFSSGQRIASALSLLRTMR